MSSDASTLHPPKVNHRVSPMQGPEGESRLSPNPLIGRQLTLDSAMSNAQTAATVLVMGSHVNGLL